MKRDPQRWAAIGSLLGAMLWCGAALGAAPGGQTLDAATAGSIEPAAAAPAPAANAAPVEAVASEAPAPSAPPAEPITPTRTGFTPSPLVEAAATSRAAVTPSHDPTDIPMPLPAQENLPLGAPRDARASIASPAASPASPGAPIGSGGWVVRTVTALAIVIGLIFGLRMLLQKLSGQTPIGSTSRVVEVLGRSAVAPRTNVLLLKVDQTVLVVGQSAAGLSTLATFDEPTQVTRLLTQINASKPLSITEGFRSVLAGFDRDFDASDEADAGDTGGAASATESAGDGEQYIDRTRNEVSGLLARIRNLRRKDSA